MSPRRTVPLFLAFSLALPPVLARGASPATDPKGYEAIMVEATQAAKKGDHAAAVAAFDRALAIKPNDQAALTDQSWSAYQLHALARAEAITRRAIAVPGDPRRTAAAYYNLGRILGERGDKPSAIAAYQASLQLRPNRVVRAQLAKLDPVAGAAAGFAAVQLEGLDETQKGQLLELLEGAHFPHGPVTGALWPRRDKTYLVSVVDPATGEQPASFHLAAFDLTGPAVRLLATAGPIGLGINDELGPFDFAAYRLTAKEYAFGVTYSRQRSYAAGFASLDGVILFRLDGKGIDPILTTTTAYEADLAGNWNEDGTRDREGGGGKAIILVRKHKTGDHFDWAKKAEGGRAVPLVWDGHGYVMKGKDPLEDDDLEIFQD
jgi:tetratricopeptide (TPR) repeat protein